MRPFRFSVTVPAAGSGEEFRAAARKAEDLGFDLLCVPDHLRDLYPPFLPLLAAADATTTLRVGTLVLNNDFRHPALVAREAATLAQLTGNRFELGIGAGHAAPEYASIGLPFEAAGVRVARLAESVAVLKKLFTGDAVTFAGAYYRLSGHEIYPQLSTPVPILIGGNGRTLLELAARQADIVGLTGLGKTLPDGVRHEPTGFTAHAVEERVQLIRAAAGSRFESVEINALVQVVSVTDSRRAEAERIAANLAPLTAEDVLDSPFLLIGTPAQMAADLQERRERFGISYISTFAPSMDALAKVIPLLK